MTYTMPYHELAIEFARRRLSRLSKEQGWLLHAAVKRHFGEAAVKGMMTREGLKAALPDGRTLRLHRRDDGGWDFCIESEGSLFATP